MTFGDAISFLNPNCDWECIGSQDEYSNFRSLNGVPLPSECECLKVWETVSLGKILESVRVERDALLAKSDWTQIFDAPVDAKAWAAYRQQLRDLPATIEDSTQPVEWPTPPA